jgi:NAD(P)-dependent dehydrogenase (short-subunit alcohol dehydrogenase family)
MDGRVCLVTGATAGIGRETALRLAALGATVGIVARDARRGERVIAELRRHSGRSDAQLFLANLSSMRAVRALATDVRARFPRLHVLVSNAAVITPSREVTEDGFERQLAVNHLAPFLLVNLLLDHLRQSAPARIVVVASQVEREGQISFEDLHLEHGWTRLRAYNQSKLANVLFTFELARRLAGRGVTANCLHPGVIATRLLDDYNGRPRALRFLGARGIPGPEEGAGTSVYLAASPEVATISGRYFREERLAESSPQSQDRGLAERLWEVSARLVQLQV